jgi:uncharacterized membrane protein
MRINPTFIDNMDTTNSSLTAPSTLASTEDKTIAIISYLTVIGFIVALVMHGSKKTRLGSYHLRQSLGLMITSVAVVIVGMVLAFIPFIGWLADLALWFGLIVLWFTGFLAAVNGQQKPVALLGQHFEKWFSNAFE